MKTTIYFESAALSNCGNCGRQTRQRCATCNPMSFVCEHCGQDHLADQHPGSQLTFAQWRNYLASADIRKSRGGVPVN